MYFGRVWGTLDFRESTIDLQTFKEEAKADVCEGVLDISSFLRLDYPHVIRGFLSGSSGKESPTQDTGSIPGLGGSPGEGNDYPPIILAWKIPWTEEPGGLQSMGLQRVGHD